MATYPLTVQGHLDPGLSRWLWLVKWVLAIPHYVVLAFLWLAFFVLSIVAMFAILFTGRYPAPIFDFNVGVLRWSWRVGYYAYGVLGTDRYPPFTLAEVPDYPAHLEVARPEHLSRGLVLVKWWLLALPHYLIVGLLIGGGTWFAIGTQDDRTYLWNGGLIGLLVLVAAVVLLFTGAYPQQIFDLVLGLNRWVLRVAAYAGLMTDQYPPFRLDMGGDDPGGTMTLPAPGGSPAPPATAPAPPPPAPGPSEPRPWSAGRVIAVLLGSISVLIALGLGAGAATVGIGGAVLRDDAGYVMTDSTQVQASTHALRTENLEINGGDAAHRVLGDVKVEVTGSGGPVFVGLARTSAVDRYLAGVAATTVVDMRGTAGFGMDPVYRSTSGGAPSVVPGKAGIWATTSEGTGTRALRFEPRPGSWTLVVMNADGGTGITADVAVGATVPVLGWVVVGMLVAAVLFLALGAALLTVGLSRRPAPVVPTNEPPAPKEEP